MRFSLRALALTLALAAGAGLSACNTVKGAQRDVYSFGRGVARLSTSVVRSAGWIVGVRQDGTPTVTPELELPPFPTDTGAHRPPPPTFQPDAPTPPPPPPPPKPKA